MPHATHFTDLIAPIWADAERDHQFRAGDLISVDVCQDGNEIRATYRRQAPADPSDRPCPHTELFEVAHAIPSGRGITIERATSVIIGDEIFSPDEAGALHLALGELLNALDGRTVV